MKFSIYAIRDIYTGFMSPTCDANDSAAVRNFQHAVMQPHSLMHSHPQDYSLYKVGEFETDTGEVTPCLPVHLFEAKEIV